LVRVPLLSGSRRKRFIAGLRFIRKL